MATFMSVCSGIEAASVAWTPLGWSALSVAEVDKFPAAVLAHHYPQVPNYGDITQFSTWPDAAPDVLVGGTPCQSFSVAGLRAGLADPRGNLALTYLAIVDRYRPRWVVWENVPGVLSADGGSAFGAFLGGLAELGYGFAYRVLDAQYFGLAQRRKRVFVVGHLGDWRRAAAVLFERESLSGHPPPSRQARQAAPPASRGGADGGGDDELVAATLGGEMGRNRGLGNANEDGLITPVAGTLGGSSQSGGFRTTDLDNTGAYIPEIVPQAMSAKWVKGSSGPSGDEVANLVVHSLRADGFDASEDGTGRGTPLIAEPITLAIRGRQDSRDLESRQDGTANAIITPNGGRDGIGVGAIAFTMKDHGADAGEIAPTLRAGGYTESHANGGVMPAIAFAHQTAPHVAYALGSHSGAADAAVSNRSHATGGPTGSNISEELAHTVRSARTQGVAIAIQGAATRENPDCGPDGVGVRDDDCAYTLEARSEVQSVAFSDVADPVAANQGRTYTREGTHNFRMSNVAVGFRADAAREGEARTPSPDAEGRVRLRDPGFNVSEEMAPTLDASAPHGVGYRMQVRRLTPRECERLQGFPDDYTRIPYRGKPAADGPRYKALGNSMAVPVMAWIGRRIQLVEDL